MWLEAAILVKAVQGCAWGWLLLPMAPSLQGLNLTSMFMLVSHWAAWQSHGAWTEELSRDAASAATDMQPAMPGALGNQTQCVRCTRKKTMQFQRSYVFGFATVF